MRALFVKVICNQGGSWIKVGKVFLAYIYIFLILGLFDFIVLCGNLFLHMKRICSLGSTHASSTPAKVFLATWQLYSPSRGPPVGGHYFAEHSPSCAGSRNKTFFTNNLHIWKIFLKNIKKTLNTWLFIPNLQRGGAVEPGPPSDGAQLTVPAPRLRQRLHSQLRTNDFIWAVRRVKLAGGYFSLHFLYL